MSKKQVDSTNRCPCRGDNLEKLIQPAILAILTHGKLHGYRIVQELSQMPSQRGERPDCTGVYRMLRTLESRGMVISSWDLSDAGPAKRIYELTEGGVSCLKSWVGTLKRYRQGISRLLKIAQKAAADPDCCCSQGPEKKTTREKKQEK